MKKLLLVLLFVNTSLVASRFDWFSLTTSQSQQFECTQGCGSWGSESIREVEWQFVGCLWELNRLSSASLGQEFLIPTPKSSQDPWYQNLLNDYLLIKSQALDCSERLYWEITHHDIEGAHVGKTFNWAYYTDFGSGEKSEDWDSYQFETVADVLEAIHSIQFHEEMIFSGHIEEVYEREFVLIEDENLKCKDKIERNKKNLSSEQKWLDENSEKGRSYPYIEGKISTYSENIKKYEDQIAKNEKRLSQLQEEYACKLNAYDQFHPCFLDQTQKVKTKYTNIFTNCFEQHGAPNALLQRSQLFFLDGEFANSLSDLKKLFEVTPLDLLKEKAEENLHLKKGRLECQIGLFEDAIQTLSNCILENPTNKDAYFERAVAYFETGDLEASISDYLQSGYGVGDLTGGFMREFCLGLVSGIRNGSVDAAIDFVPSMLSSISGLAHGIWAFACDPKEVSIEMFYACMGLIDFLRDHSTLAVIQTLIPEVAELTDSTIHLTDKRKGELIGLIIGRYGTDFLLCAGVGRGVKVFSDVQRANRLLTLEKMAKGPQRGIIKDISSNWLKNSLKNGNQIRKLNGPTFESLRLAIKEQKLTAYQLGKILRVNGMVGKKSPIAPYKELKALTKGMKGEVQAHHILEKRHLKAWRFSESEIASAPAQILSKEEHRVLTKALRDKLPFGQKYEPGRVWLVYQEVYKDFPEYLKAIEHFFCENGV
ncbi:MAG: hypothetical protein KDK56_08140 [Simkania sp.]|nr:hypothetical protein [Simkania sp.]MCP5491276.1 hypothetical protein [Chlamydiales bacterium]